MTAHSSQKPGTRGCCQSGLVAKAGLVADAGLVAKGWRVVKAGGATAWALAGAPAAWGQVPAPGDLRLMMGGVQPDTGRNVNGLRNAVSLLLESRGVGIGTLHLARRVQSHGVALRTVLRQAARQADALLRLQAQADAEVQAAACTGRAVVQAAGTPGRGLDRDRPGRNSPARRARRGGRR